ncbi:MAG: flagellar basal body rod protein FlgC [Desulfatiglans sp.]|jgi:flagellar basal-body rod protein FlgC|nr:flagellar basal body rod protein FlgC [Desulfatiglans sp.]
MDLIKCMDIAASGMTSQRTRLNVISMNLANANTTKTADGTPYKRKTAIFRTVPINSTFEERLQNTMNKKIYGVEVKNIVPVDTPFKQLYDPTHPDADDKGYVHLPNVNLVEEMVAMLDANRAYEANASAIRAAKDMATKALEIGR